MVTGKRAQLPPADFYIEIDYEKGTPNPSRVFRAMSDLIEALQSVDSTLVEPLEIKLEPILLLEDIEAGSVKTWLKQRIEGIDDKSLASGDYKQVVGSYLVKGKYAVVDFLSHTTEIKSAADIEPLEQELIRLGKDAYVSQLIPTYQPVSRQKLLNDVNKINQALEPLTENDKASFVDREGNKTGFNLTLAVAPETIDDLLTREAIESSIVMILKVKRPDFLGDTKWEFRYDRKPFAAKMADTEWLAKYHGGKEPLNPGDALKAKVQTIVKYGFEGDVIDTQHTIIEVIGVLRPEPMDQEPLALEPPPS